MSRSASADAIFAVRLIAAMSGKPMFTIYSFLSRTSLMVNDTITRPILSMSSADVARILSATISGCFTISSTVSWPTMPRKWPSITSQISPSRSTAFFVSNCSAAVRMK